MIAKNEMKVVFENNADRFVKELKEFLRYPSVGTDPSAYQECENCANWLAEHINGIGMEAKVLKTSGKPVVFSERPGKDGAPTVLFYGHYDVQPPDPLDQWTSPPFEPEIRNGRIYARGADDDKGQVFYFLKAVEALIKEDKLDVSLKIVIEGEEESGSGGLTEALDEWRDMLKADILMVSDTGVAASGAPAIIMGLRGIIHLTAVLKGPNHDIHSGIHGGVAPNPAQGISELVASLHNEDGSIAVSNYYDSIEPPSLQDRAYANADITDEGAYYREIGVSPVAGEKAFSPAERAGFRPSIDVNGISSGYNGNGMKTIIPSQAIAKISSRIVKGQDPETCLNAIISHLEKHTPEGLTLSITDREAAGAGFRLDTNSSLAQKAKNVLSRISDLDPVFIWEGASIPVVAKLAEVSCAEPLLVGFGQEEDCIHSPNESFSVEQLKSGFLYASMMLSEIA